MGKALKNYSLKWIFATLTFLVMVCLGQSEVLTVQATETITSEAEVLYSGKDKNLNWMIYDDGLLEITGKGNYTSKAWIKYADYITRAVVDVEGITSTEKMFYDCQLLEEVDLTNLDTSKVQSMSQMFFGCKALEEIKSFNITSTNLEAVEGMFYNCESLKSVNLSDFNSQKITSLASMFYNCKSLETIDLSSLTAPNVKYLSYMFYECESLKTLKMQNIDTSNVIDMKYMFKGCESLEALRLQFDTSNVTDMERMFLGCSSLEYLNIASFDTSKITNMSYLFGECTSLEGFIHNLDTSSAKSMDGMFYNCKSLKTLDVTGFETSNVTRMDSMFFNCQNLEKINIYGFDTAKVTTIYEMFAQCYNLKTINFSNCDFSSLTSASRVIDKCSALTKLYVPTAMPVEIYLPSKVGYKWLNADGETCIKATSVESGDNYYTLVDATVPITGISLDMTSVNGCKGDNWVNLNVTITPSNTTESRDITWSSSDESVATVNEDGKVTCVDGGIATITATVGEFTASCTVKVISGIVLTESPEVNKGETVTYKAKLLPEGIIDNSAINWSSTTERVATVDSNGNVTGLEVGITSIIANYGKYQAYETITVGIPITSITLEDTNVTLNKGNSKTLKTIILPSDTTKIPNITWSSSDTSIAIVDCTGKITAVAAGTATVTARVGSYSATCVVTVQETKQEEEQDSEKEPEQEEELPCAHENTEIRDAKEATYDADGYTGDTYCIGCEICIAKGEVIPKLTVVVDDEDKNNKEDIENKEDNTQINIGDVFKYNNYKYKVTGKSVVAFAGVDGKNITKVTIPKTVTYGSKTYKVTSVSAKALYKNKNVTKVTIGSNVKMVGTDAFTGCTKLKTVSVKKNVEFIIGRYKYKTTDSSTLAFTGVNSTSLKKVVIEDTVKIGAKKYKVTSIASKALYNNKKVTSVTIGSNVKTIGSNAFNGCKKLSTIKIESKVLKKVESKAFKGIASKATIKVLAKKLAAYQKLLKNKGQGSKVKIVKY